MEHIQNTSGSQYPRREYLYVNMVGFWFDDEPEPPENLRGLIERQFRGAFPRHYVQSEPDEVLRVWVPPGSPVLVHRSKPTGDDRFAYVSFVDLRKGRARRREYMIPDPRY